jgi:CheY-like chemotaxis protein
MSPTKHVSIISDDSKFRILLVSALKNSGISCHEGQSLTELSLSSQEMPESCDAVLFPWRGDTEEDYGQIIAAIKLNDAFASARFFGFSEEWRTLRARVRARMQGLDDLLALPPNLEQVLQILSPKSHDAGQPQENAETTAEVPTKTLPSGEKKPENRSETKHSSGSPRVLVVDDASVIRVGLRHLLEKIGCVVFEAENGAEGLRFIRSQVPPNLVLTDLIMPEMDGFRLMARVRELPGGKDIPFIVVSGYGDKEKLIQALRFGAVDFIVKPFRPEVVKLKTQRALHRFGYFAPNT